MRLIDADRLLNKLDVWRDIFTDGNHIRDGIAVAREVTQAMPIFEERQHGYWNDYETVYGGRTIECSVCGRTALTNGDYCYYKTDYCPHCGARMVGDKKCD